MSVETPTPYEATNFEGVRIRERVVVSGGAEPGEAVSDTKPFIVGSRNQIPYVGTILPAKTNTFYDNHLVGIRPDEAASGTSVRDQTYTCDGVDVSTHQISTIIAGTGPSTTTKEDVTRCIQEDSGR